MKMSELAPVFLAASKQKCEAIANDLLNGGYKDKSVQARSQLLNGRFYLHEGDLWIDGDLMADVNLIVDGDVIINGEYNDSESMLVVLGNMKCKNMVSAYGIFVRDDLICGGLSYHYYNDWSVEVLGTLAARAHITDDKCVSAGTWLADERGDLRCGAEAACRLLGFRDGRPDEDDDQDDDPAANARRMIEEAREDELTHLDLEGLGLTELPAELFELTRLEDLDLRNNELTNIPEDIGKLDSLTELRLDGNNMRQLPESIGCLVNIETLSASHNRLQHLPDAITQLRNLSELDVSDNEIGYLPEEIGQLQNLESLDVGHNRLTRLPASFEKLTSVWYLAIRHNPLREIPDYLAISEETRNNLEETARSFQPADDEAPVNLAEEDVQQSGQPAVPAPFLSIEILEERRRAGQHTFVVPLPPMAELIERWGEDWAWRKRLWYPDNCAELTGDEQAYLAQKGDEWLFELIISKNLPTSAFADHIAHETPRIRWALAAAQECPADCLRALARDRAPGVRAALAGNVNCPPDLRAELMNDADWRVRVGTIFGIHAKPYQAPDAAALERLANDPDVNVRRVVAAIPELSQSLVTKLFDDPEGQVRARISRFQILGVSIWERLARDTDPNVRLSAARRAFAGEAPFDVPEHAQARNAILQQLMLDPNEEVRDQAANGWQPFPFYEANAEAMARDTADSVRRLLAGVTRNADVLGVLADDSNEYVAEEALQNPNVSSQVLMRCFLKMVEEISEIEKIETKDFDPWELMRNIGNKTLMDELSKRREKDKRLYDQLGIARILANKANLPDACIEALVNLERKHKVRLFEDPVNLRPSNLVSLWAGDLEDDCCDDHCERHKEKRDILRRLHEFSQDESLYNEFYRLLLQNSDWEMRKTALATKYCPDEYTLDAVKSYIDGSDGGDFKYSIDYIAGNPGLSVEARGLLVSRVAQQHDHEVMSGLKRNPAVTAEEWLEIASASASAEARSDAALALWLWHGQVLDGWQG